jgi:hypothetical protein
MTSRASCVALFLLGILACNRRDRADPTPPLTSSASPSLASNPSPAVATGVGSGTSVEPHPIASSKPIASDTTTSAAAPSTTGAATSTCPAIELRVVYASHDAGAGNRAMDFDVVHDGTKSCVLEGYPEVTLLDAALAPLKAPILRSEGTYFTAGTAVTPVTLLPKDRAHFELAYRGTAITCPRSKSIRVKIGSATFSVAAEIQACATDAMQVTPIRAGASPKGMP